MKNKLNKRLMSWMTSGTLLTNPNYDSNSLCKVFVYPLFLLLIALGVCGCKSREMLNYVIPPVSEII